MLTREELQQIFSDFIVDNNLCGVYSGSDISTDKKYRYVLISVPRVLDGEVRIYSEKYILVSYQTAYRTLPHKDDRVYECANDALNFLKFAFVDYDFDKALNIPTKQKRIVK